MSLKIKLISAISMFVLMLGIVIIGVFAASTQTLTMTGNVNFVVADKSLYVKDVRIKQNNNADAPVSVSNFMPGFINGTFDMNLGDFQNTYGSFALYFDIINTSNIAWEISEVTISQTLQEEGVSVNYSGIISTGETTVDTPITSSTQIDGTLIVTIIAPNSTAIDLSGITIILNEAQPNIIAISSNENLGQAQGAFASIGDEVTISADFVGSTDADFLGWSTDIEGNTFVSTLPDYAFTYQADSPTTYYAIFKTANTGITYTTSSGEATLTTVANNALTNGYVHIPSMIQRDNGIKYIVTEILDFSNVSSTLIGVKLPETLESIGGGAFWGCVSLTSIEIPANVSSIGLEAFYWCEALKGVYITDIASWCEINFIGSYANPLNNGVDLYLNNELVTNLIIPDTITSICEYAFYNCSSLESLVIPSTVTDIGGEAFAACSSLTSIKIGATTPPSIGLTVFDGCSALTTIYVPSASVETYQSASGWNSYSIVGF